MSKFTAGPWAVFHDHPNPKTAKSIAYIRVADGSKQYEWGFPEIACCYGCKNPEQAANARLIAAAPELLEALQDALCALECCGKVSPVATKAIAAIAKATGETP